MKHQLRNIPLLKKVLWADSVLGGSTALAGLFLYSVLENFLGLPAELIIVIALVTLLYALLALMLAGRNPPPVLPLRVLIYANWIWTIISVVLLILYFKEATIFGAIFLILQVLVVGGLAYQEGRHVVLS